MFKLVYKLVYNMNRRTKSELQPIDTEIERILRNLKKVRVAKKEIMAKQEGTDQHLPVEPVVERP